MIALIPLPEHDMPKADGYSNLNGWWKPPIFVISFWSNACQVNYYRNEDFEYIKDIVLESYKEAIKQFWRENVL